MFVDSAYFVGEINIPNLTGSNSNAGNLNQAINQYEEEILIDLLGYKLYSLLLADMSVGNQPQSQIYIDLVNGAEFNHSYMGIETTLKWKGLKNDSLQSLIAYYVFYKYVERDITHLSGAGVILAKGEKGSRSSSVNKMINAWERMRKLYGIITPSYKCYFSDAMMGSSLPMSFNNDPSAYNFLFANKANYPDWVFKPQWNINAFGI